MKSIKYIKAIIITYMSLLGDNMCLMLLIPKRLKFLSSMMHQTRRPVQQEATRSELPQDHVTAAYKDVYAFIAKKKTSTHLDAG
jgi:hypothetical protein